MLKMSFLKNSYEKLFESILLNYLKLYQLLQ